MHCKKIASFIFIIACKEGVDREWYALRVEFAVGEYTLHYTHLIQFNRKCVHIAHQFINVSKNLIKNENFLHSQLAVDAERERSSETKWDRIMTRKSFLSPIIEYLCKFESLQNCLLLSFSYAKIWYVFRFPGENILIKTKTKYKC